MINDLSIIKHRKIVFILCFLLVSCFFYSITFNTQTRSGKELKIQAIFDIGFSAQGVADGLGITDYQTFFFRPAFHIQDFGIGFDFNFRFRLFSGDQIMFREEDWYISEDSGYYQSVENSGLNMAFTYLDKISYIVYGTSTSPIFLHVGKNPVTTMGAGLIVKSFHNHAFLPASRELGLYFKFDGSYLSKFGGKNIPLDATLLINDLLDPDIFALDFGVDVMKFTPFRDMVDLRVGAVFATDLNSKEANRLSGMYYDYSQDINESRIKSHRNLSTTSDDIFTSFPALLSLYAEMGWAHKYIKIRGFTEGGLILKALAAETSFDYGFGLKAGVETKVVNLNKSGYLLGIIAGFAMDSPKFQIDYFSPNYEVVRKKQYMSKIDDADYSFYVIGGVGIYGFDERLQFTMVMTMPIMSQFSAKFSSKFILEDTLAKGLFFSVFYETDFNPLYRLGNGGGLIDSLTRGFRFSFEAGYKFYGAKLSIVIGVQRPAWVIPEVNDYENTNAFEALAKGEYVPNIMQEGWDKYSWDMNFEQYNNVLEKFVSLEISFVF